MLELIYAREVFKDSNKMEGAYSNAKAMAQLRQFYILMVDVEDRTGMCH